MTSGHLINMISLGLWERQGIGVGLLRPGLTRAEVIAIVFRQRSLERECCPRRPANGLRSQPFHFAGGHTRPLTGMRAPWMSAAASEARKHTRLAMLSGRTQVLWSALGMSARLRGVSIRLGSTALMLTP